MTRSPAVAAWLVLLATTAAVPLVAVPSAHAHHVGAYVPRDNEVSANFKQIKFSLQAGKFDVARRMFDNGALRRELRKQAATLPAGLEASIRAALAADDARAAEAGLMVFFAALVRDLAMEADRQVANPEPPASIRVVRAGKILDAVWRYYNLIDFAVSQRDPRAATAVRLAFEEAEGYARARPPAPERVRPPLARIASVLTALIDATSPAVSPPSITRRNP